MVQNPVTSLGSFRFTSLLASLSLCMKLAVLSALTMELEKLNVESPLLVMQEFKNPVMMKFTKRRIVSLVVSFVFEMVRK
jgi:hypothetical protein